VEKELSLLLESAQNGDEDAFAKLVEMYRPLTESMARSFIKRISDSSSLLDDYIQEAVVALYSAVRSYKQTENVTFGLYAKICIRNRFVSMSRRLRKKQKDISRSKQRSDDPLNSILDKEDTEALKSRIGSVLSELEWSVFCLYVQKKSYAEIAESIGRSVKTVDNALFRIKTKLKKLI